MAVSPADTTDREALIRKLQPQFPRFAALLERDPNCIEQIEPGLPLEKIIAVEKKVGVKLPPSVRKLMGIVGGFELNGGAVQFGPRKLFVHRFRPLASLNEAQRQMATSGGGVWPPPSDGMLCFAEYSLRAEGDQVLFDLSHPSPSGEYPVHYYPHSARPQTCERIADSFVQWIEGLDRSPMFDSCVNNLLP